MSTHPSQGMDNAMLEAAAWKIRLNEEPHDGTVREEFAAWRALDARHDRAWRRMERVWAATGELAQDTARSPRRPVMPVPPAPGARHAPWGRRLWIAACGMVPVAACVMAFAMPEILFHLRADYATKTGETRTLRLPDGSAVTLAGHSAIALRYSTAERGVTLLGGEAFFDVRHEDGRGFVVTAGHVTTRDIGTAFDVGMTGPRVTVAVREGVVSVAHKSGPALRLTAGQQWAVNQDNGQVRRGTVDPQDVGSWRSGQVVLDNVPFSDAVDMLGRYYPGTIMTHGFGHDMTPVGGVYDLHHPKEALAALCALHGGRLVTLPVGLTLLLGADKAS